MAELIPANITIGDRTFRIKILPSDEEAVRKTVKIINDKIMEFRTHFAGKDMQDYISMVLIWYATQPQSNAARDAMQGDLIEKLVKINKQLDSLLS